MHLTKRKLNINENENEHNENKYQKFNHKNIEVKCGENTLELITFTLESQLLLSIFDMIEDFKIEDLHIFCTIDGIKIQNKNKKETLQLEYNIDKSQFLYYHLNDPEYNYSSYSIPIESLKFFLNKDINIIFSLQILRKEYNNKNDFLCIIYDNELSNFNNFHSFKVQVCNDEYCSLSIDTENNLELNKFYIDRYSLAKIIKYSTSNSKIIRIQTNANKKLLTINDDYLQWILYNNNYDHDHDHGREHNSNIQQFQFRFGSNLLKQYYKLLIAETSIKNNDVILSLCSNGPLKMNLQNNSQIIFLRLYNIFKINTNLIEDIIKLINEYYCGINDISLYLGPLSDI